MELVDHVLLGVESRILFPSNGEHDLSLLYHEKDRYHTSKMERSIDKFFNKICVTNNSIKKTAS